MYVSTITSNTINTSRKFIGTKERGNGLGVGHLPCTPSAVMTTVRNHCIGLPHALRVPMLRGCSSSPRQKPPPFAPRSTRAIGRHVERFPHYAVAAPFNAPAAKPPSPQEDQRLLNQLGIRYN